MNSSKIDFSKIVMFTDCHYGLRNNSRDHNDMCENFIKWMIKEAKKEGIKTCIFGGDYHHIRSAINVSTLNYSVSGLKLLNDNFDHTLFIIGNHDLYLRNTFEIHSLPYITEFPNIIPIDKISTFGNVSVVPWLVGDDWKEIKKLKSEYVFGHFELPGYLMNSVIEMPDHGTLNKDHFKNQKQVFSGHFHKRQNKGNIWYIGNAFPHNYADTWDDERGIMVLTLGGTPVFKSWPDAPKYRTVSLSKLLKDPGYYIDNKTFIKITIDIETTYEDINFIKEILIKEYNAKEIQLITQKIDNVEIDTNAEISFESVDTIVISHIQSIESNSIDTKELIRIYQEI